MAYFSFLFFNPRTPKQEAGAMAAGSSPSLLMNSQRSSISPPFSRLLSRLTETERPRSEDGDVPLVLVIGDTSASMLSRCDQPLEEILLNG